jgi:hypothetical protein
MHIKMKWQFKRDDVLATKNTNCKNILVFTKFFEISDCFFVVWGGWGGRGWGDFWGILPSLEKKKNTVRD